jgi:hypothetical protein
MIDQILRNKEDYQTVFTLSDIASLVGKQPDENLISAVSYHIKNGNLIRLSKGLYALDDDYSKKELGNKLRRPSYVSLYTVLQEEGVVFQPYTSIHLVTNRSETITVGGQKYIYRKIKDDILLNPLGVDDRQGVFQAHKERAILDKIYLDGDEYFDNLKGVDWDIAEKLNEVVYQSNRVGGFIKKYA